MTPGIPGPGSPAVPPGPDPATTPPGSAAPPGPPLTPTPGPAAAPAPAGNANPWGAWLSGDRNAHAARKAERLARRDARRAEGGMGGMGGPFWGVLLMIVGAGLLASEVVPGFDWNLAWPAVLIAFGLLLVLASIRRAPPVL